MASGPDDEGVVQRRERRGTEDSGDGGNDPKGDGEFVGRNTRKNSVAQSGDEDEDDVEDDQGLEDDDLDLEQDAQGEQDKKMLACEECTQEFSTPRQLRSHEAQHKWGPHNVIAGEEGIRFQCLFEGCGKVVEDRKKLRKHCLTHRPREFACEACGKRFYERAKLKRHSLVHSGEKGFTCNVENCNKKFAYKANLLTHMRTHTGNRPYKCSWPGCSKSFAQASNRNSHVATHSHSKRKRGSGSICSEEEADCCEVDGEDDEEAALASPPAEGDEAARKSRKRTAGSKSPGRSSSIKAAVPPLSPPPKLKVLPTSPLLSAVTRCGSPVDRPISPSHRDTINSLLSLRDAPFKSAPSPARPVDELSSPNLSSLSGLLGSAARICMPLPRIDLTNAAAANIQGVMGSTVADLAALPLRGVQASPWLTNSILEALATDHLKQIQARSSAVVVPPHLTVSAVSTALQHQAASTATSSAKS